MKTIASILTPLGEGGIGVVGLWGPQAVAIANRLFRGTRVKDLAGLPSGRICHGFIHDEKGPMDEVIVHVARGSTPDSDLVEINCHGGIVPVRKLLALCVRHGAAETPPEEFVARTSGEKSGLDCIQRDALLELPHARTALVALVLLDQFNGALSNAVRSIIEQVKNRNLVSHADALRHLQALVSRAPLGLALVHPRRLVVVGKPNVGKSTLVNALLAEERVLVHHLPGTTRDAIATMVEISGVPFELVDTAGIREAGKQRCTADGSRPSQYLEMLGIEQSWREIAQADLILVLLDSSRPLDKDDAHILATVYGRDAIFVLTKTNLPPGFDLGTLKGAALAPLCAICAQTGAGLDALCQTILARVGFAAHESGRAIPFTEAQVRALEAALALLDDGDGSELAAALSHLRSLCYNGG